MIWLAVEFLTTIFEAWLMLFFISNLLDFNSKFKIYIATIIVSIYILISNYFKIPLNISLLGLLAFGFYCSFIYSDKKFYYKIFVVLLFNFLIIIVDALVITVITKSFSISMEYIMQHNYLRFICILLSKTILFFLINIIINKHKHKNININFQQYLPILFILISCIVIVSTIFANYLKNGFEGDYSALIFLLIGYLFISILTIAILNKSIKNAEDKNKIDFLNNQLQYQELSISEAKENHDEIRKIWHDINNNLNNIVYLLNENKFEECKSYVKDYLNITNNFYEKINTGNIFIDAIISRKIKECDNYNIIFYYDVTLTETILLNPIDLCIIIENAIINAIDASLKEIVDFRKIKIQIKTVNSFIVINVNNFSTIKPTYVNKKLISSKNDKKHHGFGLINVQNIVNKYFGNLELDYKNDMFIFTATLKNTTLLQK
jgi:sensor histidine kinase YesM